MCRYQRVLFLTFWNHLTNNVTVKSKILKWLFELCGDLEMAIIFELAPRAGSATPINKNKLRK